VQSKTTSSRLISEYRWMKRPSTVLDADRGYETPTRKSYYRQLNWDARGNVPKTPPHLVVNSHIKRGYKITIKPEECLDTFTELNNETFNAYSCVFAVLLFLLLNINLGVVTAPYIDKFNPLWLNVSLALSISAFAMKLLYHIYLPLPTLFGRMRALNLVGTNVLVFAMGLTLYQYGFSIKSIPALSFLVVDESFCWLIALIVHLYIAGTLARAAQAGARSLAGVTIVNSLSLIGFIFPLYVWHRASAPRAIMSVILGFLAVTLRALRLPERCAPRTFDLVGHSRMLFLILLALSAYLFYSDIAVALAGPTLNPLLYDRVLFC